MISIPTGAIERYKVKNEKMYRKYISIPTGAIESRVAQSVEHSAVKAFQYRQVRLKGTSLTLPVLSDQHISIPTGAIESFLALRNGDLC